MANQRTQGHNWEREVVQIIAELLELSKPQQIDTSRNASRALDNAGIDVWFEDSSNPLSIQCKKTMTRSQTKKNIDVSSLDRIETGIPVLLTKVTRKVNVREREIGRYITFQMNEATLKLLKYITENAELFREESSELLSD